MISTTFWRSPAVRWRCLTRVSWTRRAYVFFGARNPRCRVARASGSLLAFARKQRLEPMLADLNSVIVEMTEMLRRSIGPSIEIRHAYSADLWPVLIDIGQIETALLNVAIN